MQVWNRLGIGTANWGKEYNGAKVSEQDQRDILDMCMCNGIDLIDTATAYENNVLDIASSYFQIILKIRPTDKIPADNHCFLMAHHVKDFYKLPLVKGVSIYEPSDLFSFDKINAIEVPYSLFDRRFEEQFSRWKNTGISIIVRSIFLRGKILEKVKPYEAIAFCLMNPCVDRVIMGVDSAEQLKENLDYFHWLDSLKVTDENIIDPRRWKNE